MCHSFVVFTGLVTVKVVAASVVGVDVIFVFQHKLCNDSTVNKVH